VCTKESIYIVEYMISLCIRRKEKESKRTAADGETIENGDAGAYGNAEEFSTKAREDIEMSEYTNASEFRQAVTGRGKNVTSEIGFY